MIRYTVAILFNINLSSLILLYREGVSGFRRFFNYSVKLFYFLNKKGKIPSKHPYEIFNIGIIPEIKLIPTKSEGIETPIEELALLALTCAMTNPETIFEIGTYRGRTALNFALNSSPTTAIFTMDLPRNALDTSTLGDADRKIVENSDPTKEYMGYDVSSKITQIFANSLNYDFTDYYDKVDLMFIDGGHSEECVRSDTNNALKMVKKGGVIIWHDFLCMSEYYPVTKVVLELKETQNHIYRLENTELCIMIRN